MVLHWGRGDPYSTLWGVSAVFQLEQFFFSSSMRLQDCEVLYLLLAVAVVFLEL